MLGFIFIYFIGKYFYDLAVKNEKPKWAYAILGIITYYGGTFVAGLIFGIMRELGLLGSFGEINDIVLSLLTLPFGILACYILYLILDKKGKKKKIDSDLLDSDLLGS